MGDIFEKIKNGYRNIKNLIKLPGKIIKFFGTILGQIVGWLILIAVSIFIISVIISVGSVAFKRLTGMEEAGIQADKEYEVLLEIVDNGYQALIPMEKAQDYLAFEYAVLMDVAKCIEEAGVYTSAITRYYNFSEIDSPVPKYDQDKARIAHETWSMYVDEDYKNEAGFRLGIDGVEKILYKKEIDPETVVDGKTKEHAGKIIYEMRENQYTKEKSLVPYLVVEKDQKDFYYLLENKQKPESVGENFYPLMYVESLNTNNTKLWTTWDWQLRKNGGISEPIINDMTPQIMDDVQYEDDLYKDYKLPSQSSYTFTKEYRIPVELLIDRYSGNSTILSSWYMLKRDEEEIEAGETVGEVKETNEVIEKLMADIKGIYNRYCYQERKGEDIEENIGTEEVSNKYTFLDFSWAMLEATNFGEWKEREVEQEKKSVYTIFNFWSIFRIYVPYDYYEEAQDGGPPWTAFGSKQYMKGVSGILQLKESIIEDHHKEVGKSFVLPPINWEYGPNSQPIEHNGATYSYDAGGVYRRKDLENQGWHLTSSQEYEIAQRTIGDTVQATRQIRTDEKDENGDYIYITETKSVTLRAQDLYPAGADEPYPVYEEKGQETEGAYPIKNRPIAVEQEIRHRKMPAYFIKNMETWAKSSDFEMEIIQNKFVETDPRFIVHKNKKGRGLSDITIEEKANYRVSMYDELFGSKVRENDVIGMLIEWEETGYDGDDSSYTYIRDLYKLIHYCKANEATTIHTNAYKYVYVPEEILDFDEPTAQIAFWTERLAVSGEDELSKEEELVMRGKKNVVTWQEIDYEKFEECNNMVYALYPIGSPYARSMYMAASESKGGQTTSNRGYLTAGGENTGEMEAEDIGETSEKESGEGDGEGEGGSNTENYTSTGLAKYNWGWFGGAGSGHEGSDLFGRNLIRQLNEAIEKKNEDITKYAHVEKSIKEYAHVGIEGKEYQIGGDNIGAAVYEYELHRLKEVNSKKAEKLLEDDIAKQALWTPVTCSAPGIVVDVRYNATSGFRVKVQHETKEKVEDGKTVLRGKGYSEGTTTFYMHLKRWPNVQVGDYVGAGTLLGYEGTTGASGTYHVHYEVRKNNNTAQDPTLYVFPIFNPFFYKEKYKSYQEKYGGTPEYASLLRTVFIPTHQDVVNVVPQKPLLEDISLLVTQEAEEPYKLPEAGEAQKEILDTDVIALKKYFGDEASGPISGQSRIGRELTELELTLLRNYVAFESAGGVQPIEAYIALAAEIFNRIDRPTGFNEAKDIESTLKMRNGADYGCGNGLNHIRNYAIPGFYYADKYKTPEIQALIDEGIQRALYGEDPTAAKIPGGADSHKGKGQIPREEYVPIGGNNFFRYVTGGTRN